MSIIEQFILHVRKHDAPLAHAISAQAHARAAGLPPIPHVGFTEHLAATDPEFLDEFTAAVLRAGEPKPPASTPWQIAMAGLLGCGVILAAELTHDIADHVLKAAIIGFGGCLVAGIASRYWGVRAGLTTALTTFVVVVANAAYRVATDREAPLLDHPAGWLAIALYGLCAYLSATAYHRGRAYSWSNRRAGWPRRLWAFLTSRS
jgi:hypothetical protein